MNSDLSELIAAARAVCVLTGAGISTESGIPDFRSPGGIWSRFRIVQFDEFMGSEAARLEDWRRRFAMEDMIGQVAPNAGHARLARWVADGTVPLLVTQNIDGLHQASGVPEDRLVELHGNARTASCTACGTPMVLAACRAEVEAGRAPVCSACGGIVKSDVVMFGQAMPVEALARAEAAARACDLFIAIGTSLVVQPAALLPLIARRAGARLAIVNREPTELDALADLVVRGQIGAALGDAQP